MSDLVVLNAPPPPQCGNVPLECSGTAKLHHNHRLQALILVISSNGLALKADLHKLIRACIWIRLAKINVFPHSFCQLVTNRKNTLRGPKYYIAPFLTLMPTSVTWSLNRRDHLKKTVITRGHYQRKIKSAKSIHR